MTTLNIFLKDSQRRTHFENWVGLQHAASSFTAYYGSGSNSYNIRLNNLSDLQLEKLYNYVKDSLSLNDFPIAYSEGRILIDVGNINLESFNTISTNHYNQHKYGGSGHVLATKGINDFTKYVHSRGIGIGIEAFSEPVPLNGDKPIYLYFYLWRNTQIEALIESLRRIPSVSQTLETNNKPYCFLRVDSLSTDGLSKVVDTVYQHAGTDTARQLRDYRWEFHNDHAMGRILVAVGQENLDTFETMAETHRQQNWSSKGGWSKAVEQMARLDTYVEERIKEVKDSKAEIAAAIALATKEKLKKAQGERREKERLDALEEAKERKREVIKNQIKEKKLRMAAIEKIEWVGHDSCFKTLNKRLKDNATSDFEELDSKYPHFYIHASKAGLLKLGQIARQRNCETDLKLLLANAKLVEKSSGDVQYQIPFMKNLSKIQMLLTKISFKAYREMDCGDDPLNHLNFDFRYNSVRYSHRDTREKYLRFLRNLINIMAARKSDYNADRFKKINEKKDVKKEVKEELPQPTPSKEDEVMTPDKASKSKNVSIDPTAAKVTMFSTIKNMFGFHGEQFYKGAQANTANRLNNKAVDATLRTLVRLGMPEFLSKNQGVRQVVKFSLPVLLTTIASRVGKDDLADKLRGLAGHAQLGNGYELTEIAGEEFSELIAELRGSKIVPVEEG